MVLITAQITPQTDLEIKKKKKKNDAKFQILLLAGLSDNASDHSLTEELNCIAY